MREKRRLAASAEILSVPKGSPFGLFDFLYSDESLKAHLDGHGVSAFSLCSQLVLFRRLRKQHPQLPHWPQGDQAHCPLDAGALLH